MSIAAHVTHAQRLSSVHYFYGDDKEFPYQLQEWPNYDGYLCGNAVERIEQQLLKHTKVSG
ncbi:MAG: hypothetical protein AB2693_11660, partial [Candidatus Thiodiazotropha sp.]